jgi:hypothetical protein
MMTDADAADPRLGGPELARRRLVLKETIDAFQQSVPPDHYHRLGAANLARWHDKGGDHAGPLQIRVVPGDWGEVTCALTKEFGVCFAALNMANAYVPGGGYVEGAPAQEENMFRRTDCHFRIGPEEYDAARDRYLPEMTRLISGIDGQVYLDTGHPRVCIRGAEDRSKDDLGYSWLTEDQVFPFFELRAAAQDLGDGSAFNVDDARRRIAAQLDTLCIRSVRHAVLGAFGCGAFQNPADRVARIYREEVSSRKQHFDVIAFAIFSAGYGPDNFKPFADEFTNT